MINPIQQPGHGRAHTGGHACSAYTACTYQSVRERILHAEVLALPSHLVLVVAKIDDHYQMGGCSILLIISCKKLAPCSVINQLNASKLKKRNNDLLSNSFNNTKEVTCMRMILRPVSMASFTALFPKLPHHLE